MNKKIYQNNRFIRTLLKLIRKLIERLMMHLLKWNKPKFKEKIKLNNWWIQEIICNKLKFKQI